MMRIECNLLRVSLESDPSLTRRMLMRGCQNAPPKGALAQAMYETCESESVLYRDSLLRLTGASRCIAWLIGVE
jgi:hypothetical protein